MRRPAPAPCKACSAPTTAGVCGRCVARLRRLLAKRLTGRASGAKR